MRRDDTGSPDLVTNLRGRHRAWNIRDHPGPRGQPEWAEARIGRKRKLRADVVPYAVINMFLIGSWAVTGFGYFWPGWVLAGWVVLLLLDAWNAQYRRPITDEDLELRSLR